MPRFSCLFIDETGKVESFESCESADDADAVKRARDMLLGHSFASAVELWESGHFVTSIPRPSIRRPGKSERA